MSLFTMIIFEDLLNLKKECNTYKKETKEYYQCLKLKKVSSLLLEQLESDNKEAFKHFLQLQDSQKFQQYLQTLEYFHTLINTNIDNYIAPVEQEQILKDVFFKNAGNNENNINGFTPIE
ncbi:MAG: hypothetical protein ACERKK_12655 [Poseidonibacter sp.]|uniref:hypothetical protein n=1 Tax=Poseidonibacter sp. TaxID=2321188 RepID=UPI00359EA676